MEISFQELMNAITQASQPSVCFPYPVGRTVFIRTVTYHYTGRVSAIRDGFVILSDAAWIADSGRWADALKTGELNEVEPYPDETAVALMAIVDASPWTHPLPREQK